MVVGVGCVVAGIAILAGTGWALIAGGAGSLLIAYIGARGAQHGE